MLTKRPDHPLVTELLGRIDEALKTFQTDTAKRVFLGGQLEKATFRYQQFVRRVDAGLPEPDMPDGMPDLTAVDHHCAMAGIQQRLHALSVTEAA